MSTGRPKRPRKPFSKLAPKTQERKLKHFRKLGLSDSQIRGRYNAGTLGPQSAARGHRATPEHPGDERRNQERYAKYGEKRSVLEAQVIEVKKALFGDIYKFRSTRSDNAVKGIKSVANRPGGAKPKVDKLPKLERMQKFLEKGNELLAGPEFSREDADWEALLDISWDDPDWAFLFYH